MQKARLRFTCAAALVLATMLLASACSPAAPATADNASRAGAPATPSPTVAAASPTADTAQPVTTATVDTTGPVEEQRVPVQVFFPKDPESFEDFSAMFSVERDVWESYLERPTSRLEYVTRFWIEGPTESERAAGFIAPVEFDDCRTGERTSREFVGETVIVTLCGNRGSAGIGEDARVIESFRQTMASAGFSDAALLYEGGQRCFGNLSDDEPLGCLSDQVIAALGPGAPCPSYGWQQRFTVVRVDEWVNARSGRLLTSEVVRRFELGEDIYVYEANRSASDGYTWVTVQLLDSPRCVYVAADFVAIADARPPVGIDFDLPTTGTWWIGSDYRLAQNETRTTWTQDEAFYTAVSISTTPGNTIDDFIAHQEAEFDRLQYDVPEVWFDEVQVTGADRAIRPVVIASESGDVGTSQVLIEVGGYTITAASDVYIEDYEDAPIEELQAFVDSISIDRDAFLAGR